MSRKCELTGTGAQYGHKVSHSNHKSKTRFVPNLQQVSLHSDALSGTVRLRITVATLRSVEHNGGLDRFLLSRADAKLTCEGRRLKRQIKKKLAAAPTAQAA